MKSYVKWLVVKAVLIAVMLALLLARNFDAASISVSAWMLVAVVIIFAYSLRHPERQRKDERTEWLSSHAASWSWMITLVVVTMLFWLDYTGWASLTGSQTVSAIFAVMVITIISFRWYFMRKGDVA